MGRLIGLLVVLLLVGLAIVRSKDGADDSAGVIPQGHQDALEDARALESNLQQMQEKRMQELDGE